MKSVLRGFLGTLTSRYSDMDGYWLFGYVVETLDVLSIDLLADAPAAVSPDSAVAALAARKFSEQMAKAGLGRSQVSSASLTLRRGERHDCNAYGVWLPLHGWWIAFEVEAVMDNGRRYADSESVCVAPQAAMVAARGTRPPT